MVPGTDARPSSVSSPATPVHASVPPTQEPWTVGRLVTWTTQFLGRKQVDSPRLSAELLLAHVTGLDRISLYTRHADTPDDATLARFRDLVRRAGDHEPVQYLVGKVSFFNLPLCVDKSVLIPRPETETLVEEALHALRREGAGGDLQVLDLCTGSGCVAAAVASRLKGARVAAVELDPAAAAVARRNVTDLDLTGRVEVLEGDLYEPVGRRRFDLILANPPYIPSADVDTLDAKVKDYEPRLALDGGRDGLDVVRRILAGASAHLAPGGRVYVELQYDQAAAAAALAADAGLGDVAVLKDLSGHDRILAARLA